jgi:hypothetical protein
VCLSAGSAPNTEITLSIEWKSQNATYIIEAWTGQWGHIADSQLSIPIAAGRSSKIDIEIYGMVFLQSTTTNHTNKVSVKDERKTLKTAYRGLNKTGRHVSEV